jgi:hypothetical protein
VDGVLVADHLSMPCAQLDAPTTPASNNEDASTSMGTDPRRARRCR